MHGDRSHVHPILHSHSNSWKVPLEHKRLFPSTNTSLSTITYDSILVHHNLLHSTSFARLDWEHVESWHAHTNIWHSPNSWSTPGPTPPQPPTNEMAVAVRPEVRSGADVRFHSRCGKNAVVKNGGKKARRMWADDVAYNSTCIYMQLKYIHYNYMYWCTHVLIC